MAGVRRAPAKRAWPPPRSGDFVFAAANRRSILLRRSVGSAARSGRDAVLPRCNQAFEQIAGYAQRRCRNGITKRLSTSACRMAVR